MSSQPIISLDFQPVVCGPLGRRDPKDESRIRAHLMRQYHERRRNDLAKGLEEILEAEEETVEQQLAAKPSKKAREKKKSIDQSQNRQEAWKIVQFQPLNYSPQTPSTLGAGKWDPFLRFPGKIPKGYHELIDHCVTVFWPGAFGKNHLRFAQDMIPKFAENPLSLWSTLFTSASHLEGLRDTQHSSSFKKELSVEQLERKVSAIQAVNAAMSHENSNMSDELILTILVLSSSEDSDQLEPADWSPFDAPLRSMQWINITGKRNYFQPHVNAMQTIIKKRGGLRNIKTYGVPCAVSRLELTWCAASLSVPTYPLLDPFSRDIEYTPFVVENIPLPLAYHLRLEVYSGFSHLAELHLYPKFRQVLLRMKEYSDMVELHMNGAPLPNNMLDNRIWVFHNLLKIPRASALPQQDFMVGDAFDRIKSIYELSRIAAILYSIHVIYPTPRSKSPRERLLPLLREAIERMNVPILDQPSKELVLWCLIIGGIAATGLNRRIWFILELRSLCALLDFDVRTEWPEVEQTLRQFAWVRSACKFGGEVLWKELFSV